jgi:hypothetical protein
MDWEIRLLCKRANIPVSKEAASLSFSKRLRGWRALVNELVTDPDDRANWLEIITDIKLMEGERHRLVHGLWAPTEEGREDIPPFMVWSFREPHSFQWAVSKETINEVGDKIAELNAAISWTRPGGPWGLDDEFDDPT